MSGCLTPGGASGGLSGGTKYRASRPGRTVLGGGRGREFRGDKVRLRGRGRGNEQRPLCLKN